jgi:hypothetical protein
MRSKTWTVSLLLLVCLTNGFIPCPTYGQVMIGGTCSVLSLRGENVFAAQNADEPNMEWFKKELRISPKYKEHEEGLMGLSWAHFLTMVFLVIFFIGAIVAVIIRHRETKKLLNYLLEKDKKNASEG